MPYMGDKARISWGKESTYGSLAASTDKVIQNIQDVEFTYEKEDITKYLHGEGRKLAYIRTGKRTARATIPFIPHSGEFISCFFDKLTESGTGPYTHEWRFQTTATAV